MQRDAHAAVIEVLRVTRCDTTGSLSRPLSGAAQGGYFHFKPNKWRKFYHTGGKRQPFCSVKSTAIDHTLLRSVPDCENMRTKAL